MLMIPNDIFYSWAVAIICPLWTYFIFEITRLGRPYCPHFTREETEAQNSSSQAQIPGLNIGSNPCPFIY